MRAKSAEACASRSNRERAHHGIVLPPGVEPGPLGFQPSALTNCAKEGCGAARVGSACGTCFIRCLARHLIIITLQLSETTRRHPRGRTSGLGAFAVRGRTIRVSRSGLLNQISITQSCIVLTIIRARGVSRSDSSWDRSAAGRCVSGCFGDGLVVVAKVGPKRRRATWFARVALTQSTL